MPRLLSASVLFALATACGTSASDAPAEKAPTNRSPAVITPVPGGADDPGDAEAPLQEGDCAEVAPGDPVPEGEWVTADIGCGDEIVGHTEGGVGLFDTKFYEHFQCTPATTKHDGTRERVYRLKIPEGDKTAVVTLHSPCADLDLAAFKYSGTEPPTVSTNMSRCEMNIKPQGKPESVRLVSRGGATWYLVVEGKDEESGAFALGVECHDGLN